MPKADATVVPKADAVVVGIMLEDTAAVYTPHIDKLNITAWISSKQMPDSKGTTNICKATIAHTRVHHKW